MTQPALAPRHNSSGHPFKLSSQELGRPEDPFATPTSCSLAYPEPACLHMQHSPISSTSIPPPTSSRHDSLQPSKDSKSSSISSQGSHMIQKPPAIDPEKRAMVEEATIQYSPRPAEARLADPEKAVGSTRTSHQSQRQMPRAWPTGRVSLTYELDDEDDTSHGARVGRRLQEQHALRILLFLSGPCVLFSMLNTGWALISVLITILTQPVRLCARRPSFGLQLAGLLGPALNLQLRSIYTPLPPHANEDLSYHSGILILVHLFAPFVSLGLAPMAWVVAIYWASSAVVGDPTGTDKRDDGRETALGLRKWWENFLLRSVQQDSL